MNEYKDNNNTSNGSNSWQNAQNTQNGSSQQQNYGASNQNGYYYNYGYNNNGYDSQNTNEYSYQPQKKKKGKKVLNAALAILCVCAIGTSSVVGYSLLKNKLPSSGGSTTTTRSSDDDDDSTSTETDDTSSSSVDRTNLPTIEQLSTPDDALSIPEIVTKVSPSVVGISCITDGSEVSGTGIIMSEDGYIITNAHVVEDATAISVVITDTTASSTEETSSDDSSKSVAEKILENQNDTDDDSSSDENTITAELVGIDTQTDLAVLKIDKTGLTAAEFGTSSELQVGEAAIVIGNPLGFDLANTVTSGIISATDRTLTIEDRTMNLIQTDASINSGNSGGPLINAYGQVIGITSAKVSSTYGEGLGFAIPIDEALDIVEDLIQYGYVKGRPSLGISGTNISSFYAQYYDVPEGFIVATVEEGSAADNAGIQVNDIVVGIQGELTSSIEDFNEIKSEYKAGDTITVSVYRNSNIIDLEVTLDEASNEDTTEDTTSSEESNDNYDNYQDYYNYFYGNR